jgi:predicted Zn-dependent protease
MAKTLAGEYWDKAFEYYFDGESDRAIAAGRKAMELNPRLARPHWIIGHAYIFRKPPDPESALKEFRQLVEKDPRWYAGHAALGSTLEKQGRIIEALKCYREAFRLRPKDSGIRINFAQLLLKRNDFREAIHVLRAISSPFGTEIDAYHLLARAMEEKNYELADVRAVWEHILTFDESIPANQSAMAEARARLKKDGASATPKSAT